MNIHPFYHFLKERSEDSLPGQKAHMKMAPIPLSSNYKYPEGDLETAHPSGVMALLFPDEQQKLHVLLTLRTDTIRHAG